MNQPTLPFINLSTSKCVSIGEFYALSQDEAKGSEDSLTFEELQSEAGRWHHFATFRLPHRDDMPKDALGNYKYHFFDATALWEWVKVNYRDPIITDLML